MKYDFNEIYQRIASEKWEYDSVINGFPVILCLLQIPI